MYNYNSVSFSSSSFLFFSIFGGNFELTILRHGRSYVSIQQFFFHFYLRKKSISGIAWMKANVIITLLLHKLTLQIIYHLEVGNFANNIRF